MMLTCNEKLVDIASAPIITAAASVERVESIFGQQNAESIGALLNLKNGFYAFEGALHVRADTSTEAEPGLLDWNSPDLWRGEYGDMTEGCVFFAEDVFGNQFCLHEGHVCTFDAETGSLEFVADSVEMWAKYILDDYKFWTGYPLAHEWQESHGPIPIGSRLVPVTPFVMGGEYVASNLRALDAAAGMKYRASIAMQIRDLPDGAHVKLKVVE